MFPRYQVICFVSDVHFARGMFTIGSVTDSLRWFVGLGSMAHGRDTQKAHGIFQQQRTKVNCVWRW